MTARSWMSTGAGSNRPGVLDRPVTRACCPDCRLRFDALTAARLPGCPECGEALGAVSSLERVVGFGLFRLKDLPPTGHEPETPPVAEADAVALPLPDP